MKIIAILQELNLCLKESAEIIWYVIGTMYINIKDKAIGTPSWDAYCC